MVEAEVEDPPHVGIPKPGACRLGLGQKFRSRTLSRRCGSGPYWPLAVPFSWMLRKAAGHVCRNDLRTIILACPSSSLHNVIQYVVWNLSESANIFVDFVHTHANILKYSSRIRFCKLGFAAYISVGSGPWNPLRPKIVMILLLSLAMASLDPTE